MTSDQEKALQNRNLLRERLGFLFRDSAVYGGASAISKAVALITFPILARHLGVVEYGRLDFFLFLSAFLLTCFVFGQDSAVGRFFFEYVDTRDRSQLITQSLIFQLAGLALLLPILWFFSEPIASLIIETPNGQRLFKIVVLLLPFSLLINFSLNLLKYTFKRTQFLVLSLGSAIFHGAYLVSAILVFDTDTVGVLQIRLIANTIFGIVGVYFIRNWLSIPKNFDHLFGMLPFAVPYGLICVLGTFSPTLERFLIEEILGPNQLGEYAVAFKFALLLNMLIQAFQTAWGPFALNIYKDSDATYVFNWVLKLFTFIICVSTLILTILSKSLIVTLTSGEYAGGEIVIFPLLMALTIESVGWITEVGIGFAKRSYFMLYAEFANYASMLLCVILLTPIVGLLGIGISVMVGKLVKALMTYFFAQNLYPLRWDYSSVLVIIGLTFFVGFVSIGVQSVYSESASNFVLVLGILVVLLISGFSMINISRWREFKKLLQAK